MNFKSGSLLFLILMMVSCANYNSSTFDQSVYQGGTVSQPIGIIQLRCASCHQHSNWNSLNTDALWIASGYVISGDSANSILIQRLYRNGGSGNMPPQNDLTLDEYTTLKNWIDNLP